MLLFCTANRNYWYCFALTWWLQMMFKRIFQQIFSLKIRFLKYIFTLVWTALGLHVCMRLTVWKMSTVCSELMRFKAQVIAQNTPLMPIPSLFCKQSAINHDEYSKIWCFVRWVDQLTTDSSSTPLKTCKFDGMVLASHRDKALILVIVVCACFCLFACLLLFCFGLIYKE